MYGSPAGAKQSLAAVPALPFVLTNARPYHRNGRADQMHCMSGLKPRLCQVLSSASLHGAYVTSGGDRLARDRVGHREKGPVPQCIPRVWLYVPKQPDGSVHGRIVPGWKFGDHLENRQETLIRDAASGFDLEHQAAAVAVRTTGRAAHIGRSVERAALSEVQPAKGCKTIAAAGKTVEHAVLPEFASLQGRRQRIHRAAIRHAALHRRSIEVSVRAKNRGHLRYVAFCRVLEIVQDRFRPGSLPAGRELEDIAVPIAGPQARAIEISRRIEQQTRQRKCSVAVTLEIVDRGFKPAASVRGRLQNKYRAEPVCAAGSGSVNVSGLIENRAGGRTGRTVEAIEHAFAPC